MQLRELPVARSENESANALDFALARLLRRRRGVVAGSADGHLGEKKVIVSTPLAAAQLRVRFGVYYLLAE